MDKVEAEEASGASRAIFEKTTLVSFMAPSKQRAHNKNGKRWRSKTSEIASALGVWRSYMERTSRQQARNVMEPHQSIDRIARLLEAYPVCDSTQ